jgi:hypothetical protein
MRVTPSQVIIDDPRRVKLFNERASEDFLHSCESVLDVMLQIPLIEKVSDERILDRLESFKSDMVSSLANTKIDLSDVIHLVKSSSDSIMTKVDGFSQLRNTNRFKGDEGEKTILEILQGAFHTHDGYVIKNTKTVSHSCDIVIQRPGFTDIRIESKAYGCDTGADVNATEVKKFISDLVKLNTHGIMVSLYSGISNKESIDIEIVPSTNKLALYISGSENLVNLIRLVFRLDKFFQNDVNENKTILTNDSVAIIRDHILDCTRKAEEIRTHMKHSLRLLNEMAFSNIEKIVVGSTEEPTKCPVCQKAVKGKAGLSQHRPKCKGKPIDL